MFSALGKALDAPRGRRLSLACSFRRETPRGGIQREEGRNPPHEEVNKRRYQGGGVAALAAKFDPPASPTIASSKLVGSYQGSISEFTPPPPGPLSTPCSQRSALPAPKGGVCTGGWGGGGLCTGGGDQSNRVSDHVPMSTLPGDQQSWDGKEWTGPQIGVDADGVCV